ncbi:MAG: hypothetical protein RL751_1381, partial [Bacteroidota bacterium]
MFFEGTAATKNIFYVSKFQTFGRQSSGRTCASRAKNSK